jgi:hypothetical protein
VREHSLARSTAPSHTNANSVVHFNRIVGNTVGGIAIVNGYSGTLD